MEPEGDRLFVFLLFVNHIFMVMYTPRVEGLNTSMSYILVPFTSKMDILFYVIKAPSSCERDLLNSPVHGQMIVSLFSFSSIKALSRGVNKNSYKCVIAMARVVNRSKEQAVEVREIYPNSTMTIQKKNLAD